MYTVLGASGNTGHMVAKHLLSNGKKVRVVGRNADHLQFLAKEGAEVFIGDVSSGPDLISAFRGVDSAYVMIPPDPTSNDVLAFQNRVIEAIAEGLRKSVIKNVVALSSIGADKPRGTGPVLGLHNLEKQLNQIDGANILFLRAGYFMENTLPQASAIHRLGFAVGPLHPDLKIPMIATCDIGKAAGEALLRLDFRGKQTRELLGNRDLDYKQVATIIGDAIGQPDLKYIRASNDQLRANLVQTGMSPNFVDLLLEMAEALNSGYMRALEPRSPENTTSTRFEDFVAGFFVPAYQEQVAA